MPGPMTMDIQSMDVLQLLGEPGTDLGLLCLAAGLSSHGSPGWLQAEHCPLQSQRGGTANSPILYLLVGSTSDPPPQEGGQALLPALPLGTVLGRLQLPRNSSLESECSVMQQLCCSVVLVSTTWFYIPS